MDTNRRDTFIAAYEAEFTKEVALNPQRFRTADGTPVNSATIKQRSADMTDGLFKMNALKDGPVTKAVLKKLRIKNTYRAIRDYLSGGDNWQR
jgi:hypothetical protein